MFAGAILPGPVAALLGVPLGGGMADLWAASATGALANILANVTTDELKGLISTKGENNHDLQKCIMQSLYQALEEIYDHLADQEESQYGDLISDTLDAIRKAKNSIELMDILFAPGKDIPAINDYYFSNSNLTEEHHDHLVWSGIHSILMRLDLRYGRTWQTGDETLRQAEAALCTRLPQLFRRKLQDNLKQSKFEKSWKAFQREMFMTLHQVVNNLAQTMDHLGEDLDIVLTEAQRNYNLLLRIERGQQEIQQTLQARFDKQDEKLEKILVIVQSEEMHSVPVKEEHQDNGMTELEYITPAFLDSQSRPASSDCSMFYKGDQPSWGLVHHNCTARRHMTDTILRHLAAPGFQAFTLTGAGGEGKTTVLMQVAAELSTLGYEVYFARDTQRLKLPIHTLDEIAAQDQSAPPLALFIDNASLYTNASDLIQRLSSKKRTIKIILADRTNIWMRSSLCQTINKFKKAHSRAFLSEGLKQLDQAEAGRIAELLVKSGTVPADTSTAELSRSLLSDANGFLLSAMLTTTYGIPLREIIHSVLLQLEDFDNGDKLLDILSVITIFDVVGYKHAKEAVRCDSKLLVEIFNNDRSILGLLYGLSGEVHPKMLTTRHESITNIFRELLFESGAFRTVDEDYLLDMILTAVGERSKLRSKCSEGKLLYQIPQYYGSLENYGYEFARKLYKEAVSKDRHRFQTWIEWAGIEVEHGNLGTIEEEGSARWIYYQSIMQHENETTPWLYWSRVERDHGELGTQDEPYTARWIAMQGSLKNTTSQALWKHWAELEETAGNMGDVNKEYSARWIYFKITDRLKKSSNVWYNWAIMEREAGNYGDHSISEYNYHWIVQQGRLHNPNDISLIILWARLEKEKRNYGAIDDPEALRGVIKRNLIDANNDKQGGLWILAVEIERERRNIGSMDEPFTARWYVNKGLKQKEDNKGLWILAAEIEFENDHPGSLHEENSGRWFFKKYADKFGLKEIASAWGKLEILAPNLGEDVHTPYSARWILWEGIKSAPKELSCWNRLLELELVNNNIGSRDTPYTAVWLFNECKRFNPQFSDTNIGRIIYNKLEEYL